MSTRFAAILAVVASGALLAGCATGGSGNGTASTPSSSTCSSASTSESSTSASAASTPGSVAPQANRPTASGTVKVLYAGSLLHLMDSGIKPGFQSATGATFDGEGAGSTQLVSEIKGKVKQADVFVSASTAANDGLRGNANGNWESWYASFATSPLLIGYNPQSKFAGDLKTKPWNQVITEKGFLMGSTDPKLDPKGKLAATALKDCGISQSSVRVFPEEQLVGRLQSGQLDAGFFYSSESTELKIPTIPINPIHLQATYTVTVLNNAPNPSGGVGFVDYLLSQTGQQLMRKHGLVLSPISVSGDSSSVPQQLRGTLGVH